MNNRFFHSFFRLLIVVFIAVIIFYFFKILIVYFYPFWIAYFLAILFNPFIKFIQHKFKVSRLLATLITIFSFLISFVFFFVFLGFFIFEETLIILESLPSHINQFLNDVELIINNSISIFNYHILSIFYTLPETQQILIKSYISDILTQLSQWLSQFLNLFIIHLTNIITSISYIITVLFIICISLFFIMKDFSQIKAYTNQIMPSAFLMPIQQFNHYFKKSLIGLIRGQVIITSISSLITFIGLFIFKIDHAITIAILAFFVDFIPYVGIGMIFIPWIIYCFMMNHYVLTIKLSILYIILIIVRQLIEPKILSESIGIHPLVTLIILFVCFTKWGLVGIVLAPMILMTISSLHHSGLLENMWTFIKN